MQERTQPHSPNGEGERGYRLIENHSISIMFKIDYKIDLLLVLYFYGFVTNCTVATMLGMNLMLLSLVASMQNKRGDKVQARRIHGIARK